MDTVDEFREPFTFTLRDQDPALFKQEADARGDSKLLWKATPIPAPESVRVYQLLFPWCRLQLTPRELVEGEPEQAHGRSSVWQTTCRWRCTGTALYAVQANAFGLDLSAARWQSCGPPALAVAACLLCCNIPCSNAGFTEQNSTIYIMFGFISFSESSGHKCRQLLAMIDSLNE